MRDAERRTSWPPGATRIPVMTERWPGLAPGAPGVPRLASAGASLRARPRSLRPNPRSADGIMLVPPTGGSTVQWRPGGRGRSRATRRRRPGHDPSQLSSGRSASRTGYPVRRCVRRHFAAEGALLRPRGAQPRAGGSATGSGQEPARMSFPCQRQRRSRRHAPEVLRRRRSAALNRDYSHPPSRQGRPRLRRARPLQHGFMSNAG